MDANPAAALTDTASAPIGPRMFVQALAAALAAHADTLAFSQVHSGAAGGATAIRRLAEGAGAAMKTLELLYAHPGMAGRQLRILTAAAQEAEDALHEVNAFPYPVDAFTLAAVARMHTFARYAGPLLHDALDAGCLPVEDPAARRCLVRAYTGLLEAANAAVLGPGDPLGLVAEVRGYQVDCLHL